MTAALSITVPVRTVRTVDADATFQDDGSVDPSFVTHLLDDRDVRALDLAIGLRASAPRTIAVHAVCLSEVDDGALFRDVVARGPDSTMLLREVRLAEGPLLAAAAATAAVSDAALAFAGDPALGGALARRLGVPHVTSMVAVRWADDALELERVLPDGGSDRVRVPQPAVLTLSPAAAAAALPPFAAMRAADGAGIGGLALPAGSLDALPSPQVAARRWAAATAGGRVTEDVDEGVAMLLELIAEHREDAR